MMNETKANTKLDTAIKSLKETKTCDICSEPDDKLSLQSLGGAPVNVCRYCMRSPALAGALGASAMHEMTEEAEGLEDY